MQVIKTSFIQTNLSTNNNRVKFTGHTEKATPVYRQSSPGGSGHNHDSISSIDHYEVKGGVPNYPGAYPNEHTKVYVAAPFEIVPDEAYRTHDYTRRTDMRLSYIQENYKRDFYPQLNVSFAQNSKDEKEFLEGLLEKAIVDEGLQEEKNKRLKGMFNMAEKQETKDILSTKLQGNEADLLSKSHNTNVIKETLANANERHTLLTELDELRRERESIKDAEQNPWKLTCYGSPESRMNDADVKLNKIFAEHKVSKKAHKESANAFDTLRQNQLINKQQLEENIAKEKANYETTYKNALKEAKELRWKWNVERKWVEYQKDFPAAIAKVERLMDECLKKIEVLYRTKYPHWL